MKSRVDYRLPAALLSLTLLSGPIARGEEPLTGETFVFTPCPCDSADAACRLSDRDFNFLDRLHGLVRAAMACEAQPADLAFNFTLPTQCSCGAAITLCGHICDGQRCYETDDAAEAQTVATELAADAKEDLNFRIETRDVAPPMPMLRAKQTAAAVSEQAAPARCELGSPAEAVAAAALASYGPEMLEIVRLRCELEAAQQQLEMQRTHHTQHAELLVELHEAKGTAAALASQQEMVSQFVEHTLGLVEEKAELAAKLASAEAGQEASQRLHTSELEAVRLEAELAAAKEWISHRLAAEQTMPAPMVAFPYPMPPMFAPPGMIPAPLAVYEPQFVAAEADPASTARPWQRNPVPFAFGTYAPQDPALLCPACPVAASTNVTCGNAACQDAACSNTDCGNNACSTPACGSCSDLACAAPSGKVVSQVAEAVDASAACECKDCDRSECSCADCGCAEQGVCGCEKSCPSSACPAAAAADANFADRGQPSAEPR